MTAQNPNVVAAAEVFGVAPDVAFDAIRLTNPSLYARQLGEVVADALTTQHPHPMEPVDPAVVEDSLTGLQDVDWTKRSPEDKLAVTGFCLGQLSRLGFEVTIAPRRGRNG